MYFLSVDHDLFGENSLSDGNFRCGEYFLSDEKNLSGDNFLSGDNLLSVANIPSFDSFRSPCDHNPSGECFLFPEYLSVAENVCIVGRFSNHRDIS